MTLAFEYDLDWVMLNHPYHHHLTCVQRPRSTRSSSVVTLARPPSSSSPCVWGGDHNHSLPGMEGQGEGQRGRLDLDP